MRVLGIDPGSNVMGYAVVEQVSGKFRPIVWGVVDCRKEKDFPAKLIKIFQGVSEVIREYSPDVLSIENVFVSKNVSSALKLGHARGAAIVAAANQGLEVHEYSPLEIKQSVTGTGRADKDQVNLMVKRLCNIKEEIKPTDASDAIATAVCHLCSSKLKALLAGR